MKILFVTPGPIEWASSRFRAHWLQPYLDADIIEYNTLMGMPLAWMETLNAYGAIVWLKQCDPAIVELTPAVKHFWDVTDPMWWFTPQSSHEIVAAVDGTIVCSQALGENFTMWSGRRSYRIDDCMSLDHYVYTRDHKESKPTKLIWFGLAINIISLYGGLANLERLAANGVEFELTILTNQDPGIATTIYPTHYVQFDLNTEALVLAEHDIAYLPPYPGPWGKVKSLNKRFAAFSAGLPVSDGFDYLTLLQLCNEPDLRQRRATSNRKMIEDMYTSEHQARKLLQVLEGTAP